MTNENLKDKLLTAFQANEANLNGVSKTALHQKRREAIQYFEKLGFPTTKHEEWKYSNVSPLTKEGFELNASTDFGYEDVKMLDIPKLKGNILYFVNGIYNAELSVIVSPAEQLTIYNWAEALKNKPELLDTYFAQYANYQNDAFTALNTAFAHDGVVIEVPDNTVVEEPVILRFITDARTANVAAQPRNLIVAGKNTEVKVAESYRTVGENAGFVNTVTEIVLGENANVQHYKIQNDGQKSHHIGTTQVNQADNSHFYSVTVTINGGFVRNNLNIVLNGQHCEAFMYGLYFPNGKQHVDNHTLVDHAKPNSYSNELYKGILKDKSTGVFNGKIFVRPDAQKTNAYQSCRNVVLSDDASMNTKPQLEIYADDVKCSHGTTTGKLNDEAIFYMRSRGIPLAEAQTLLMYAFCEDVISQIKIDPIRAYLEEMIAQKLAE
ncbi:MAG: Fe-S cluster assembly protein SufD [Cytophagia bacterium]|jgi:Fe-S cluster assembly protein SufD|nr:MAG: Fe-S cluster assembly protein SufD [Runella sp.]TAG16631.1 MAG: Fe-S cluster assembly protein SufD [Cytophagales bacterium]TAG35907.1 MAG: Fe-S cluster assembly protein SufD [Cytophagia bacterium]TAG57424.1 MAG: Fe-S cluster assembly protein SufD [Runella slithyformis]TAG74838.1 MAG: Fe-S cluster assembly protein SufD [Runella slithyformis]